MANTLCKSLMIVLCAVSFVCASGAALAATSTTGDGDWSGAIWSAGEPDGFDIATVQHNVTVTQAGELADAIRLDGGTIALSAGTLTLGGGFNQTHIGYTNGTGDVVQTGGTWTQDGAGASLVIGAAGVNGSGTYTISGGTLECINGAVLGLSFGGGGSPGTLTIEGNGATINASTFVVGGNTVDSPGILVIRPTANGAAGLSTINVSTIINLGTGTGDAVLTVDPQYDVQVGDSWIVATSTSLNGTFATVNTPAEVEVSVVAARALERGGGSAITVTVTAAPAVGMPAMNPWGMALLLGLLSLAGYVTMRRIGRKRPIA